MHPCAPTRRGGKENFKCNNYEFKKIGHIDLLYYVNDQSLSTESLLCLRGRRRKIISTFELKSYSMIEVQYTLDNTNLQGERYTFHCIKSQL